MADMLWCAADAMAQMPANPNARRSLLSIGPTSRSVSLFPAQANFPQRQSLKCRRLAGIVGPNQYDSLAEFDFNVVEPLKIPNPQLGQHPQNSDRQIPGLFSGLSGPIPDDCVIDGSEPGVSECSHEQPCR